MSEKYVGVKFESAKVGEFSPTDFEQKNIAKLLSLRDVYTANKFLDRNGGNFSFRADKGFIIKSTGAWIDQLTAENFSRVTDVKNGKVFYEGNDMPSSECRTHFLTYQKNSAINFIIHAHAKLVSEREDLREEEFTVKEQPYGTLELAEAVSELAKTHDFVIAHNHGVFAFGKTFEETYKILLDNYAKYKGA